MGGPWDVVDDCKFFHAIDRELYTFLVRDLSRDPLECLNIMGLWMWFERGAVDDVVSKIFSLSPEVLDRLVDEAEACLKVLRTSLRLRPKPVDIPLTCTLLRSPIYMQMFCENRDTISQEVYKLANRIYLPALIDLKQRACNGEFGTSSGESLAFQRLSWLTSGKDLSFCLENEMGAFSRTMFAIFAEGSPVAEPEICGFFTLLFGNCIESLHMNDPGPGREPVYARICFYSSSYVHRILKWEIVAKLVINGKSVWMRPYVSRIGWKLKLCAPSSTNMLTRK
ncbi:uncharacterized protein LOC127239575 [Andrographis paniculata]|uniref:uncharacterized protein LOC127239575 n=1 Tax=Andrographis paniculata TaxID=175694 RepID=UPI0021E76BA1|nr:uncharacterized protein LOC127239575 [Andrographis paniculata]